MFRQAGIASAAAAVAVVVGGSPAFAATDDAPRWEVGAQLAPAPVSVTGTLEQQDVPGTAVGVNDPFSQGLGLSVAQGSVPTWLLALAPDGGVALQDSTGRDFVRVDATGAWAAAPAAPALTRNDEVVDRAGTHAARVASAPGTATPVRQAAVDAATSAPVHAPAAAAAAVRNAPQSPAPFDLSGLGWRPITALPGGAGTAAGLPWAAGLGVLTLLTGAAGVTLVARRRLI